MMPLQRVRVAESRMRNKLANGPLRVQSNGCFPEYSATCGHTSVAEYWVSIGGFKKIKTFLWRDVERALKKRIRNCI